MGHFDMIIKGGTVATAVDTYEADVAIKDGTIVALGSGLARIIHSGPGNGLASVA